MPQTTRFTLAGTDFDYRTDVVEVEWEEDRAAYDRLDNVVEVDVRRQRVIVTIEAVWDAVNSNANGVNAAELWEKIKTEQRNGNTCNFVPDTDYDAPTRSPLFFEITTRDGGYPIPYAVEKGSDKLKREMTLQGKNWLDPTNASDKSIIDDINSYFDTL